MRLLGYIACFIITLAVTSCANAPVTFNRLQVHKGAQGYTADHSEAYYRYTLGMLAERHGNYRKAIKYYNQSAMNDKTLARAYRRSATLSLRLGDIKSAEQAANKGLKADPDNLDLLELLGGIYQSQGNGDKAIKYFLRMTRLAPGMKRGLLYLAFTYMGNNQPRNARYVLKKFAVKFPDAPEGFYYTAMNYIQMKNWGAAERRLRKLIDKRPDFLGSYAILAWVLRVEGKPDKAVEVLEKYTSYNPDNENIARKIENLKKGMESSGGGETENLMKNRPRIINLYFLLGMQWWRRAEETADPAKFQKALDMFQLAQAASGGHSRSGFYIANIFERIGLFDEAVGTWDRLGEGKQGPEARDIHLKIAELRERQGRIQESLDHALMATRIDSKDPELLYFDGILYNRLGNYPMAESYFKKAITLNPSNEKYYFYIGVVYEKMKQYDKSISAMKSVLAINQNHSSALNYLGYIYADQGKNLDEAEKFLLKALKIEPGNGYFIDSLGWIYYRKHDYKKALKLLLEAVRKIPPDPTVLEHLGDVYAQLGANSSAIDAYERALKAKVDDDRDLNRSATQKKLSTLQKKIKEGLGK